MASRVNEASPAMLDKQQRARLLPQWSTNRNASVLGLSLNPCAFEYYCAGKKLTERQKFVVIRDVVEKLLSLHNQS